MILPQYKEPDMSSSQVMEHANDLEKLARTFSDASVNPQKLIEEYKELVNKMCSSCSRQEEHEDMVGLLCILLDGIDEIIADITLLSAGRMSFLARIPGFITEHLDFPESRMPC